tara:strand:+ start:5404 stop:6612 length:1209 start_codon:yes stop_codon:yes gene_type:complete
MLKGRRILIAVSGGIAAYKTPFVIRELIKRGAEVRVIVTENAQRFVTPQTLSTVSGNKVYSEMFCEDPEFTVLHVELAEWAECVAIVPATANVIAKAAHGFADDLLSTLLLNVRVPIVVAPAMEHHMLLHPTVIENSGKLRSRGWQLIEPEEGDLASGAQGKGRLPEIQDITDVIAKNFDYGDLNGLKVLVTAGPTVEDIDPVRFIGNRSTGKMGYALARRAKARGAEVTLVSGPTDLHEHEGIEVISVRSAREMHSVCVKLFEVSDVAILAAAVSDYRPTEFFGEKIKRSKSNISLELIENPDIAAELGVCKGNRKTVLFAMETDSDLSNAKDKLIRKQGDLIVMNNLFVEGAGFGHDTNVVTIIDRFGEIKELPKISKDKVADNVLDCLLAVIQKDTSCE